VSDPQRHEPGVLLLGNTAKRQRILWLANALCVGERKPLTCVAAARERVRFGPEATPRFPIEK